MINQIFDLNSFKVISLFSLSPGSGFRRKEIKDRVKLNNAPLDKALHRLLSAQILMRKGNLYKLNFENENAKKIIEISLKQYKELKELPLKVYLLLLDLIPEFSIINGIEVYLFGSYSKLIYSEKSDVDIAVLTPEAFNKKPIQKTTQKLENVYKKNIETHFFVKRLFYKNKKDPLVKEIIKNGMRLI